MRKRLIIVGAGGFGREVYAWVRQMIAAGADLSIAGFLDRDSRALDGFDVPHAVIGDPDQHEPRSDDAFACAVGNPEVKLKLAESLRERGGRFIHVIHPTAIVGPGCQLGDGAILCPFAVLTSHVRLGNFVTVNVHAGAGHDAVLGDGTTLAAHADITGGARLGRGVTVGSHAAVLPGVTIDDYAVVGAGSVVVRDVPARTTVMGVPARAIWDSTAKGKRDKRPTEPAIYPGPASRIPHLAS